MINWIEIEEQAGQPTRGKMINDSKFDKAWFDQYMQKFNRDIKPFHPDTMESDEGPESDLQRKCNEWLDARGYPYIHDRSRKKNKRGKILDLHIYLPAGRHVVIELKVTGNKMSPEQLDTYRKILYLGHEIYEVRTFKRFLEIMEGKKL